MADPDRVSPQAQSEQMNMAHTDQHGNVDRVMQRIVRIDKSPMNPRINCLQLECGHDAYQPVGLGKRPRVGGLHDCERCLDAARRSR